MSEFDPVREDPPEASGRNPYPGKWARIMAVLVKSPGEWFRVAEYASSSSASAAAAVVKKKHRGLETTTRTVVEGGVKKWYVYARYVPPSELKVATA